MALLILVLDLTVPLGFSGLLKLIFVAQQEWRPVPWQVSVPSICWTATGADVPSPACTQPGFLPNQYQTHSQKCHWLGQGKELSSQLRQLHIHQKICWSLLRWSKGSALNSKLCSSKQRNPSRKTEWEAQWSSWDWVFSLFEKIPPRPLCVHTSRTLTEAIKKSPR